MRTLYITVLLSCFFIIYYYLHESSLFIPDWDTSSYAFWGYTSHQVVHQDGTHILLGYIVQLYLVHSDSKVELLYNMRFMVFIFGIAGIILYSIYVYNLFKEKKILFLLMIGFYIFVPYYRFIISSMDDNFYSYPFLSLFCLSIYKYYDEEKMIFLLTACTSLVITILIGLSYAVFGIFLFSLVFKENINKGRIIQLTQGAFFFVTILFLFLLIHKWNTGLDSFSIISENYIKRYFPDSNWNYFYEMLSFSWTESLTGCQNLDCDNYARESLNPKGMPNRKVYFFSIVLLSSILSMPFFYFMKKDRKNFIFSSFSLVIIIYFLLFLGYTKSFETQERFDFLSFIIPYLLSGLEWNTLSKKVKGYFVVFWFILFTMFFRYQIEISKKPSPLKYYQEFSNKFKEFHFSSQDYPSFDRGRHLLAWIYFDNLYIYDIGDKYYRGNELYKFSNINQFKQEKCNEKEIYISPSLQQYLMNSGIQCD